MEEPGRLQSMGSLRVEHNWATSLSLFTFMHWGRKWQPTPVFLPGESQGRDPWWAAFYGVAQSLTWLKRLSSRECSIAVVPQVDQQVVCHQLGAACMEPGTKQIDAGELAGLRGVRGSHGGSCSLSMCAWDGYHLGISACGNASNRHKGPSGCLWETESKVLKPGHVSLLFLHPLNLVGSSTTSSDLLSVITSRSTSLENQDLVGRKWLALLTDGEAFLLWVFSS